MATSYIPTSQKIQNLEINTKKKIEGILKQAEEDKKILVTKRNTEIIKIFDAESSYTIDNKVLKGFLIFQKQNRNHPILKEFKELSTQLIPKSTTQKQNAKSA